MLKRKEHKEVSDHLGMITYLVVDEQKHAFESSSMHSLYSDTQNFLTTRHELRPYTFLSTLAIFLWQVTSFL